MMKDMRTLCVERQVRASKHAVNVTAMTTRLLVVNAVDRLRAGLTRIPRVEFFERFKRHLSGKEWL